MSDHKQSEVRANEEPKRKLAQGDYLSKIEDLDRILYSFSRYVAYHEKTGLSTGKSLNQVEAKKAVLALFEAIIDDLIGTDEQQEWDEEYHMCNRCEFELIDDTKDCICVQRNKLRAEMRKRAKDLLGGA